MQVGEFRAEVGLGIIKIVFNYREANMSKILSILLLSMLFSSSVYAGTSMDYNMNNGTDLNTDQEPECD